MSIHPVMQRLAEKLNRTIQLTISGCLGPCDVPNVALLLTPALVLASRAIGSTQLTLVFPPLLVAALAITATVVTVVIYDGEYTWIEGVSLIALYCLLAAAFWWG